MNNNTCHWRKNQNRLKAIRTLQGAFLSGILLTGCFLFLSASPASAAISSVRVEQRSGTLKVDINYALSGNADEYHVTLEVSRDGGATYDQSATSLSGDIGSGVTGGSNRHIVWNAGEDWEAEAFKTVRVRITADPAAGPAPEGFALIPGGSFEMGDHFGEGWSGGYELPVHTVEVSAFYMGRIEVTRAQWDAVRSWALNHGYTDLPAGGGKGPNHPVQTVSWSEAVKWLNAWSELDALNPVYRVSGAVMKTGTATPTIDYSANGYRLPTEAEWEKAARGGLHGRRFPWGDTISHNEANYLARGGSEDGLPYDTTPYTTTTYHPGYNDGTMPYTSRVGSFAPNGYGLYDMAGNIWEWCSDWYSSTYYSSSPGVDPRGPSSGTGRVFRGGSWGYFANDSRVSNRYSASPGRGWHDIGFRPARSPIP